ncbi:glycoside hydrolase family 23 protein [Fomitiporia mediterranea MF3/22]|uniref:glycoside hydrolase family 23 protein n=1 Tax=Fomitiporia mediterranea (strain MF3/22) TaxID=694068 RepID=UPI0004408F71|nr:glycoside hydrolase family 23 protein [Fomitiporia mediterranea MF3/22]EJD02769.1 glycoside hydrolase family 23 protein [Fomitiporia mediterranea MF3/22]
MSNQIAVTSAQQVRHYTFVVKNSTLADHGFSFLEDVTATTGPNGKIDWLNCGLTDGGWHPPYVSVNDLVTKDLSEAVSEDNSPFKACSEYIDLFNKYGWANNIPPIMLASFAMQESSCKPWTVGGAGEQGLMQLTKDKCGDAPGGDCKNPDFNIRKGAEYFAQSLQDNGGSVLLTIGRYNGWYEGMTYGDATSAMYTSCCRCQKNCDYLHQFVNGWLQNVDAYTVNPPLGQFFNLNKCN